MREYARVGLLVGVALALVGNFATSGGEANLGLLLVWLALGAGVGLLVAVTLARTARQEEEAQPHKSTASLTRITGETRPTQSSPKFYALSRQPSSSELRALMVDAPAVPGTPLGSRLQLIVEKYDTYMRIPMTAGSLLDYDLPTIWKRAMGDAVDRAPVASSELDFVLTCLRSEGPLADDGHSPFGWSFVFVDGRLGIRCEVVITAEAALLSYSTAVDYPKMVDVEWISPRAALNAVRGEVEGVGDHPLYLRINFPSEYHLISFDPLAVFAIEGSDPPLVVAANSAREPFTETAAAEQKLTMSDARDVLMGAGPEDLKTAFRADKDRAMRRMAKALHASCGPAVVQQLTAAIEKSAKDDHALCGALLHLLSRIPSGLAVLALHDLGRDLAAHLQSLAMTLFDRRRRHELSVSPDPLEALEFEESRALLGKTGPVMVALMSTYDPEVDLLPPLAHIGLHAVRVRRLSGDTELFLAAYLRTSDGASEALIASAPLPVPCHIMRIVGAESESLAELVGASVIAYTREEILGDVKRGRLDALHRGALYMAALGIDEPDTFQTLADGITRYRSNIEARRACLAAMARLSHSEVDDFLANEAADPDVGAFAKELLERRLDDRGVPFGERPTVMMMEKVT